MGTGCFTVQALLLYDTIRRAWDTGDRQCQILVSPVPCLLAAYTAFDRSVPSPIYRVFRTFRDDGADGVIASMLVEQPIRRPTVFDILRVAHEMSGTRPEVDYVSEDPWPEA